MHHPSEVGKRNGTLLPSAVGDVVVGGNVRPVAAKDGAVDGGNLLPTSQNKTYGRFAQVHYWVHCCYCCNT